jgi:hypothetical protein
VLAEPVDPAPSPDDALADAVALEDGDYDVPSRGTRGPLRHDWCDPTLEAPPFHELLNGDDFLQANARRPPGAQSVVLGRMYLPISPVTGRPSPKATLHFRRSTLAGGAFFDHSNRVKIEGRRVPARRDVDAVTAFIAAHDVEPLTQQVFRLFFELGRAVGHIAAVQRRSLRAVRLDLERLRCAAAAWRGGRPLRGRALTVPQAKAQVCAALTWP